MIPQNAEKEERSFCSVGKNHNLYRLSPVPVSLSSISLFRCLLLAMMGTDV